MGSRLVNVRLDRDRVRKVRILRERGVTLSDVVRDAIDERFDGLEAHESPDVAAIVRGVFERFPDPPGLQTRRYDVHDARDARVAVRRKLGRT